MFNEIVKGYLIIAMRDAGEDKDAIGKAVCALENAFDDVDAAAARKAYRDNEVDRAGAATVRMVQRAKMEKELSEYEAELHELKTVKRQEVRRKIEKAREKGDLAENYDYDIAKDEQCEIEHRIAELEKLIEDARNRDR